MEVEVGLKITEQVMVLILVLLVEEFTTVRHDKVMMDKQVQYLMVQMLEVQEVVQVEQVFGQVVKMEMKQLKLQLLMVV